MVCFKEDIILTEKWREFCILIEIDCLVNVQYLNRTDGEFVQSGSKIVVDGDIQIINPL